MIENSSCIASYRRAVLDGVSKAFQPWDVGQPLLLAPSVRDPFTDPASRIMKTAPGFEQCYNAQAAVWACAG